MSPFIELGLYFAAVTLVSIASFWVTGLIYGFLHRPAIYFPLSLAAKMMVCALFGSLLFVIGGLILSTLVFNGAMSQRADYVAWSSILAGGVISVIGSVVMYYAVFSLAFRILD